MLRLSRAQCPVAATVDVIAGKWKPLILHELKDGPQRYGALLRGIEGSTRKVLTEQLRQLEQQGIVQRRVDKQEPVLKVEYSLSSYGETLRPILKQMCDWGLVHMSRSKRSLGARTHRAV
jgi:DNA-binding HxlR family transcriptional regulator